MSRAAESGYAPVDGVLVYWESRGAGGTPLLLVHGGYGVTSEFDALAGPWSRDRRDSRLKDARQVLRRGRRAREGLNPARRRLLRSRHH